MAGVQIAALPHKANPKCNTEKGLKIFRQEDGTVDGFCFACKTYVKPEDVPDYEEEEKQIKINIEKELAEVPGYPVVDLPTRKLRADTLEKFGAKVSLSEKDGKTPTAVYWPVTVDGKTTSYHVRGLHKDAKGKTPTWFLGKAKNADLLNWENAKRENSNTIIITEGPEDMASVRQIYDRYNNNEDYPVSVCSLPMGVSSARKVIQKHAKALNAYKNVIFCYDDDEPGRKALEDSLVSVPKGVTVTLPYKDANECIMKGVQKKAFEQLAFNRSLPKNTSVISAAALHAASREPAEWGKLTWPFPKLNDLTRNIRTGETIYIGAGVKQGKGELRNELAAHIIKEDKQKIFIVSPEESNKKSYKLLAGKLASKFFHDPKIEFDFEAFDAAGEMMEDMVHFLDVYQNITWENVKRDIAYMADWGAKAVFLDPITNFTDHIDAAAANTELQKIAQESSTMALDLDMTIFLFCHLKAPEGNIAPDVREKKYREGKYIGLGNCPHEMGGSVYSTQFAGSRAMMR